MDQPKKLTPLQCKYRQMLLTHPRTLAILAQLASPNSITPAQAQTIADGHLADAALKVIPDDGC